MTSQARQAGLDSIAHWKRMRDDPECIERPFARDCPLCRKFIKYDCRGCPVRETTRDVGCYATPWHNASRAWRSRNLGSGFWHGWQTAANREIKFLEGIFLKEEKNGK